MLTHTIKIKVLITLIKELEPLRQLLIKHEEVNEIVYRISEYSPEKQKRIHLMLADIITHDTLELLDLYSENEKMSPPDSSDIH